MAGDECFVDSAPINEAQLEAQKIRRLQIMIGMVMSVIGQDPNLSLEEASELAAGAKRAALAHEASRIHQAEVGHIPLHHQVIPWAMRNNVTVVHRADNRLLAKWVRID